jgi:hypothetical protein
MVVGMCRIELSLPGNGSLKGKRSIVRGLIDRIANRFNVAVAEVDHQDVLQRASVGVAVVSNDGGHANSMLDQITQFTEGASEALVVDRSMELVHFGEQYEAGGDWSEFADEDDDDR